MVHSRLRAESAAYSGVPSVNGHSLCFQLLPAPHSAAIVFLYVSICICTFISVGLVPRTKVQFEYICFSF